jgi:F-type H+-transporting ATPase subunit gamma
LGYYRYVGRAVASSRTDIGDRPTAENAAEIVDGLMEAFASGRLDAVYIVHARFRSAISTPPTTEKILPVAPPSGDEAKQQRDYLLFPSAEEILSSLLPAYVRNMVYRALVENTAAFYSAQRTAMKNATDNASDMLNILRRTYNRARQANITQEIAEIVGGASALQG